MNFAYKLVTYVGTENEANARITVIVPQSPSSGLLSISPDVTGYSLTTKLLLETRNEGLDH